MLEHDRGRRRELRLRPAADRGALLRDRGRGDPAQPRRRPALRLARPARPTRLACTTRIATFRHVGALARLAARWQLGGGTSSRARRRRLLWQRTAVAVGGDRAHGGAARARVRRLGDEASRGRPDRRTSRSAGCRPSRRGRRSRRARARSPTGRSTFCAGGHSWPLTARRLEVSVNWRGAVSAALRQGDGSVPVRGFRRLGVRLFGADVTPAAQAYDAALQYELDQIGRRVDRRSHDAVAPPRAAGTPVVRAGAHGPEARAQRRCARDRPGARLAAASAHGGSPGRGRRAARHRGGAPAGRQAGADGAFGSGPAGRHSRRASSSGRTALARLLDLPRGGRTDLRIAGPGADSFFVRLDRTVERPAAGRRRSSRSPSGVRLVPAREGPRRSTSRRPRGRSSAPRSRRRTALARVVARAHRAAADDGRGEVDEASRRSSARTRRSTAGSRTGSTTCSSSRT